MLSNVYSATRRIKNRDMGSMPNASARRHDVGLGPLAMHLSLPVFRTEYPSEGDLSVVPGRLIRAFFDVLLGQQIT